MQADIDLFDYESKHAIASRSDINGAQYFVNSGGTKQPGLETKLTCQLLQKRLHGLIRSVDLKNSFTYYVFSFNQYIAGTNNYSGNRLVGVPRTTFVTSVYVELPKGFHVYVQYNHTAKISLNDANTAFASSYHLVQTKFGWNFTVKQNTLGLYIGVDNLLNQQYSLGNDLNAFGGRYYNAAPKRNFYFGTAYCF